MIALSFRDGHDPFELVDDFAGGIDCIVPFLEVSQEIVVELKIPVTWLQRGRLLAKLQLTAPGRCRHHGYLRTFLAEGDCAASVVVSIVIPRYVERWGFGIYCKFAINSG